MRSYDVVIVGACTAGTYLSNLIGLKGHKVLVIDKDKEENLSKRLDIFHFIDKCFEDFDIPKSQDGDKEYVKSFDTFYSFSALNNYKKTTHSKVDVMHLPLFIEKLRKIAIANGVEFEFENQFIDLIYSDNGEIRGIKTLNKGEVEIIEAKLVIDASGIPSVVRKKIQSPYMETFDISSKEMFYVLLKYVEFKDKDYKVSTSTSWPYYKAWLAPQHSGNGAIIGTGACLSYDYTRKCMDKFLRQIPLSEWKLSYEELGCTPYRRPPFSFVSDRFMAIGDAACLTKPWNGEGVTACFTLLKPASEVINDCLSKNDLSVKALWPINVEYQRGEGATYANDRALIVGAVNMTEEENDFLFKNSIVFKSDDEEDKDVVKGILKGLFKGEISLKSVLGLLKSSNNGAKLLKHYQDYPLDPEDYHEWAKKAQYLWDKAGSIADSIKDAD